MQTFNSSVRDCTLIYCDPVTTSNEHTHTHIYIDEYNNTYSLCIYKYVFGTVVWKVILYIDHILNNKQTLIT